MTEEEKMNKFQGGKLFGHVLKLKAADRKEVRKNEKFRGMFEGAGIYLFVTEKDNDLTSVYAGKATHLDVRANDRKRLKNVTWLYLIKLERRNKIVDMDENWRQQLEHKMIEHLMESQFTSGFQCENDKFESPSKMLNPKPVNDWFEELKRTLGDMGCPGFTVSTSSPSKSVQIELELKLEELIEDGLMYENGLIEISASKNNKTKGEEKYFPIDVRYQDRKKHLIDLGALVWNGDNYFFAKKVFFTSMSQATAIIYNTQPGVKVWKCRKPNEKKFIPMNEHESWAKKRR